MGPYFQSVVANPPPFIGYRAMTSQQLLFLTMAGCLDECQMAFP